MNLRDLHYLINVADSGQFARGAKLCNVSQPSLSIQLKKLEEELGIALFERGGRQLIITQAGKVIVEQARSALDIVRQMRVTAKQYAGKEAEFRLGIIPTLAPYLLPSYLPRLHAALPHLKLALVENQTAELERLLLTGALDAIIIALPLEGERFKTAKLYTERCLVAVPLGHRLAKCKRITTEDLANEVMLLLDEGHCLRNQALSLCDRIGMQQQTSFRATSLETLRPMVAANAGITIMPESAIRKSDPIAYIPCNDPGFSRDIAIAWRHSTPNGEMIEVLRKHAVNPCDLVV